MLNSMTGFGQGECSTSSRRYACELQSVNHRYLETRARLPKRLGALELQVLKILQGRFARGRFDVTVLEELTLSSPARCASIGRWPTRIVMRFRRSSRNSVFRER